ncbi:MAG: 3TM-type holin [Pseudomonadota bacterium]
MSASALIGLAAEVGAPLVRRILERRVGGGNAKLAIDVAGAVARRAGIDVSELDAQAASRNPQVMTAIRDVETGEAAELIAVYAEEADARLALLSAESAETEPRWKSAWRPAMMYLIGFFWLWSIIIVPVSATFGIALDVPDLGLLMQLTLVYLSLYMGGHTVKAVAERFSNAR